MVGNRYSQLLFTRKASHCPDLRMQEKNGEYDVTRTVPPVRITSQINSEDITMISQKNRHWLQWRNELTMSVLVYLCVQGIR